MTVKATSTEVDDDDRQEEDERDDSKCLDPPRSAVVVRRWVGHEWVLSIEVTAFIELTQLRIIPAMASAPA